MQSDGDVVVVGNIAALLIVCGSAALLFCDVIRLTFSNSSYVSSFSTILIKSFFAHLFD